MKRRIGRVECRVHRSFVQRCNPPLEHPPPPPHTHPVLLPIPSGGLQCNVITFSGMCVNTCIHWLFLCLCVSIRVHTLAVSVCRGHTHAHITYYAQRADTPCALQTVKQTSNINCRSLYQHVHTLAISVSVTSLPLSKEYIYSHWLFLC